MGHHHHDHDHVPAKIRHERPLWWALGLTAAFLVAEVVAAFLTNSLALLSDAGHMATDTLALMVALVAVRLSRRPPDARRTFGYIRLEALGALFNGSLLFLVAGYILWEAWGRFRNPPEVGSTGMLLVALGGLAVNLVAMRLLKAGSGENLNLRGAYLEVWADMLGSVAVVLGALLIGLTGWNLVDPVLAVLLGLWVLPRTWALLREAGNVLMEGVPRGIDLQAVSHYLVSDPQVEQVHDLHVWALGSRTPALTAHVVLGEGADAGVVARRLRHGLRHDFGIDHSTLQLEVDHCGVEACEAGRT